MYKSIKIKILTGLLIVIVACIAAIFWSTVYGVHKKSRNALLEATVKELRQADKTLTLFFDESKQNAAMLTLHPRMEKVDESLTSYKDRAEEGPAKPAYGDYHGEAITKFLKMLQDSHPNYRDVYFGTKWGGFLIANAINLPGGYDPTTRPWYAQATATPNRPTISKAYKSSTGEATISIGKAVNIDNEIRGVVAMDVSLDKLTEMVKGIRLGQNGYVVLIQDDGVVIANPADEKTNFVHVRKLTNTAYAELFAMNSGSLRVHVNGKEYTATVVTSPELGWKFIGFLEEAEIMAPVYTIVQEFALVFGICLIIICIFVWYFTERSIVRPLRYATDFLGHIGGGNYDKRLSVSRKDEIGVIYESLNTMSAQLGDNLKQITVKTQEAEEKAQDAERATLQAEEALVQARSARAQALSDVAERLEHVVSGVTGAMDEISVKADGIRNGTDIQRERITTTATAMEEMNATVLEVAQNAGTAADYGMQARDRAQQGAGVVEESITAMQATQKQAEILNSDMAQLDTQAQSIGHIMTVIEDIADQTNLLALNAAIEAARAGEAGRGFAVVADEVRKLAEKTMQATKEVGDSIVAIQRVAAGNVSAMQAAVHDLEKAAGLANESGQALVEIVAGTEESAGQIQSIATAAEEQSAASEEITSAIEEINSVVMETAVSVEDTSVALEHLADQSARLVELIEALQTEAKKE